MPDVLKNFKRCTKLLMRRQVEFWKGPIGPLPRRKSPVILGGVLSGHYSDYQLRL